MWENLTDAEIKTLLKFHKEHSHIHEDYHQESESLIRLLADAESQTAQELDNAEFRCRFIIGY